MFQESLLQLYRDLYNLGHHHQMLHRNTASLSRGHHGIHIITQQTIILIPTIDYFYGHASTIRPTFSYSGQLQEGFMMNDV
jgi:hypothetical protein